MKTSTLWTTLLTTLATASGAALTLAEAEEPPARAHAPSGQHDFDFLHGRWQVKNRRLAARLESSDEWIEFDATTEVTPLPGGLGHLDIYRSNHWPDFVGITFRIYNPASRRWSLVWIDNHNAPGVVQPAVVGAFEDGVGVFTARDKHEGRPILVRFIWKVLGDSAARWEQAFSTDEGLTWETNWTMDFTRVSR